MHLSLKFILFGSNTLHVSDGLSVRHQEFKTVHTTTGTSHSDTADCLLKHVECYSKKKKIQTVVHLVGFTIETIYRWVGMRCSLCNGTARLKRDGTRAETRFSLSAKRMSPFKLAGGGGGGQFSRLLAAEVCASAVVMLDTPFSEAECKTTSYPLHSHVSPSLPLPCVTVCHQVSTGL